MFAINDVAPSVTYLVGNNSTAVIHFDAGSNISVDCEPKVLCNRTRTAMFVKDAITLRINGVTHEFSDAIIVTF